MKLKVFSVYDEKAESFGQPFFFAARGMAVRAFIDLANDGRSTVSKHPVDFHLYEIGEYDDSTGRFDSYVNHVALGRAREFIKAPDGIVVHRDNGSAPEPVEVR